MSKEEINANETIANIISNLKPNLKRSLSSADLDEDSFSTPKKIFKEQKQLDSSFINSPTEIRRLRIDLTYARRTISDLKSRIDHMHNIRKEMQILFDSETKSLKQQHERDQKTIKDLEAHLQIVLRREMKLKEELVEVRFFSY